MVVLSNALHKIFFLLPLAYPRHSPVSFQQNTDWSHENHQSWSVRYPQCGGRRQSPIHLKTATTFAVRIPPLRFHNYDIPLQRNITLTNTGHTIDFDVPPTRNGQRPYISGGIMQGRYEAVGVHFHWGSKDFLGSEHVIDNRRYDAEMHIVHRNVKYRTIEEATKYTDGLSVIAVMFKIVLKIDRYYPGLNKIFNKLPALVQVRSSSAVNSELSLRQLLGDLNTKNFFTYSGSLSTPDCAEAVTWQIFPEPLPIALVQIHHFNYDDPREWYNEFPQCAGNKQSPIVISMHKSIDVLMPPILFGLYDIPFAKAIKVHNNGHTVEFKVPETVLGERPFITGGLLDDLYEVENVHFHWGSSQRKGSEHILNGNRYDLEMHIVHRNKKYPNLQVAQHFEDGIAVIGVLFKIVKASNVFYPGLNVIYNNLPSIQRYNKSSDNVDLRTLGSLLGHINREDFYTYQGSLTTPPCAEAVTWIIFADVLPISYAELPKFWKISDEHGQQFVNVRPIQTNGFRKVFHRKPLMTFKYFAWSRKVGMPVVW